MQCFHHVESISLATPSPGEIAGTETLVSDPGGRASEIDAIRGWAALSVVCFHVFWETFGVVVPWLRNPYTAWFLAGRFDVILFFILSGDALSFPFFHGGNIRYLQRAAFKRYSRLTVPIAVTTATIALAMSLGLAPTAAAGRIVQRTDWLGSFAQFPPRIVSAVKFALYYVYVGGYPANYLPFLWTMQVELVGSFFLLLTLFVLPRIKGGVWLVLLVAYVLVATDSFVGCFLIGLMLGKARAAGIYARLPNALRRYAAPLGLVLSLWFVAHRQISGNQTLEGLALAGAALLFCAYASQDVVDALAQSRVSQFLGRISFLVYLWHFVVLVTLSSGLIVWASGEDGEMSTQAALAIGVLTVVISVAVARGTLAIEGWARSVNFLLLRWFWQESDPSRT